MTRFSLIFFCYLLFGAPVQAFTSDTGYFEDLEFVAPTNPDVATGQNLALCHVTNDIRLMGVTLFSDIAGYALATDNCTGTITRKLSPDDLRDIQAAGLIDASIPAIAKNDVRRNLTNYGLWLAVFMGLVAVIIRRTKSLLGYDLRGPIRRRTTQKIVEAMCHAGRADGVVDGKDIALIRATAQRLTRRAIKTSDIVKIANRTSAHLTEAQYIDFGRGLRDGEKDLMMRGVFYVALAGGRLSPNAYQFLTGLAHGIGMPGEDFRRVMNLALGDLDLYPPR